MLISQAIRLLLTILNRAQARPLCNIPQIMLLIHNLLIHLISRSLRLRKASEELECAPAWMRGNEKTTQTKNQLSINRRGHSTRIKNGTPEHFYSSFFCLFWNYPELVRK